MLERVFLHIGQPKTGTTYLQDIVWSHRDALAAEGLVLPGRGHREHLWAALDVQERPALARRHPKAPGTFERLCEELDGLEGGSALLTHEFFCGATAEQAVRAVRRLPAQEVHVVVTARHTAALLAAGWQEMVKNGGLRDIHQVAAMPPGSEFSWQTWDLEGVLTRWSEAVPAERLHVLPTPPPGSAPDQLWRSFAGVLGVTTELPLPERRANPSLGPVEVELLRRVNHHLEGFDAPVDRGHWIRGYLAEQKLRPMDGTRFALPADLLDECRQRSERAVRLIEERGFPVVGDPEELLVPAAARPGARELASVTEAELLEAAARLVAAMLADVRELSKEPDVAPQPEPEETGRRGLRRWVRRP